MKKYINIFLVIILSTIVLVACSSNNSQPASSDKTSPPATTPAEQGSNPAETPKEEPTVTDIRIGTSSAGSLFYVLGVGISELATKYAGINATVEPVGGSDPNIFALDTDKIDLSITNADSAYRGYAGEAPFNKEINVELILQGQKSFRNIVVTTKSGIEKPEDLAGKKMIAKRPSLPEMEMIANALLDVYDIPKDDVQIISTVETKEVIDALNIGSVDAAVFPGSLGSPQVAQLFQEGKVKFLDISKEKAEEMLKSLPKAISYDVIPANSYPNQPVEANAFQFKTYLVASDKLPEKAVYDILKSIFEHEQEFFTIHNAAKDFSIENTLHAPKIPYHSGAIRYLKEIGKWDASMDELQKSLQK